MSHITEFIIIGLAGRKKPFQCKLDRHLNVFYGLNGSGKTSLIKILHSAMSGDSGLLKNVPFSSATVKIFSLNYNKVFTREIKKGKEREPADIEAFSEIELQLEASEFVQHKLHRENQPTWTQEPPIEEGRKEKSTSSWRHRYLPTSRLHIAENTRFSFNYPRLSTEHRQLLTEEQLDTMFAESIELLWSYYSSDLLLAVRTAQEEGLARILEAVLAPNQRDQKKNITTPDAKEAFNCLKNFLERQGTQRLLGKFRTFQERYEIETNFRQLVADIHKVEREIQQAMAPRDKLQSIIERLYTGDKHVSFGDRSINVKDTQGSNISLTSLSSGEKHLMRILVETLLAEQCSIMIDEPELSMHIDWQRELLSTMNVLNPNAQFIIATHSPEIMADVPDERIVQL